MKENLHCYAPGNGALEFVWLKDGKATGRPVTAQDAQNCPDAPTGHRLHLLHGRPALVADWQRIDAGTVQLDGRQYAYAVDNARLWPDGEIPDHALTLTASDEAGTHNVAHISTRKSLRFWLQHEANLPNTLVP